MSGGGRCPRHRRWSRRRHEGGAKICDDDDDGVERVVKPAAVGILSDAKDSICAPDRRIGRGRLRVNAEGILYVLDSEDEDDMDVHADGAGVATEGAATANGADLSVEGPPVADDGAASDDLPLGPPVSGDGAAGEVLPLGSTHVLIFYAFCSEGNIEPTVESKIFKALERAKLMVDSRKEAMYSRCGRTDKGVSATGQIRRCKV